MLTLLVLASLVVVAAAAGAAFWGARRPAPRLLAPMIRPLPVRVRPARPVLEPARRRPRTPAVQMDDVEVRLVEAVCPVCKSPMAGDLVGCSRCGTPHHRDCWGMMRQCGIFGCGSKRSRRMGGRARRRAPGCARCGDGVSRDRVDCYRCGTAQHRACFREAGACGCGCRRYRRPRQGCRDSTETT